MNNDKKNIETKNKIIDSAILLFNKEGFSGASISDITNEAKVSKGNLYYYFKDKDELYLHCAKKCINDFRAYLINKLSNKEKSELLVIEIIKIRISFFEENPNYSFFFFNNLAKKPNHLANELKEIEKDFRKENLDLIIECLQNTTLGNGVTPEDISTFILTLQCFSLISTDSCNTNNANFGDDIIRIATIFINGLRKDII